MRCMNGLGEEIYKQGYELLMSNRGMKPEEMRPYITGKKLLEIFMRSDDLRNSWNWHDRILAFDRPGYFLRKFP